MLAVSLALALTSEKARAQDYPDIRLLRGTTGDDSILLECDPTKSPRLECTVTQTLVRHFQYTKMGKKAEIDAVLAEAGPSSEKCKWASAMKTVLATGVAPPDTGVAGFSQRLEAMPPGQVSDVETEVDATLAVCNSQSRSAAELLLQVQDDKVNRSCRVSSIRFKQTFRTTDDGANWIRHDGPTGVCGVITVSKLQRSEDNARRWTYTTEKTVTKRKEMLGDLLSCLAIDEQVHSYRQERGAITYMNCDYVSFEYSPILP